MRIRIDVSGVGNVIIKVRLIKWPVMKSGIVTSVGEVQNVADVERLCGRK